MKRTSFKEIIYIILLFLFTTSTFTIEANANEYIIDYKDQEDYENEPNQSAENDQLNFLSDCTSTLYEWISNFPAYSKCCNNNDICLDNLAFRVDFLWWIPSTQSLALGSEEELRFAPFTLIGTTTKNFSHIKQPKFKYDPGFRLGIGYFCPCACWDLAINWVHYHSKASTKGKSELPSFGLGQRPIIFINYWEAIDDVFPDVCKGHWNLNSDLIDLELGHKFYTCPCFSLRPHIGFRAGIIDQSYHIFSKANRHLNIAVGQFNRYRTLIKEKSDFSGFGPRIGLDVELDIGCGLSIVGQAAGSILLGNNQCRSKEHLVYYILNPDENVFFQNTISPISVKDSTRNCCRSLIDMSLGIQWDKFLCFCNYVYPITIRVLWERHLFHSFENFCLFPEFNPEKEVGDLFVGGLTLSLNLGF